MKLKLLLFLLLIGGILNAQDTIRSLVITEAFVGRQFRNHVEITNMGSVAVQLNQFIFARCNNISELVATRSDVAPRPDLFINLPDKVLQPGESFLLTDYCDWMVDVPEKGWDVNTRTMLGMPKEWEELADVKNYRNENLWKDEQSPLDSVGPNFLEGWWGRNAYFIAQMFTDTTGVVVDQVAGVWDNANGNGGQRIVPACTA